MKKALAFIAAALTLAASCTARQGGAKQGEAAADEAATGKKVLVAYFSCTGTTEAAAKVIAEATGGTLYRIAPKTEYTAADLDWRNEASRSSVEMHDEASRPELADHNAVVEKYDVVFVGYPIWWNLCPRAVNTFMEAYNFEGKTVAPFATSGGSSIDNSAEVLARTYSKGITWKPGLLVTGSDSETAEWARGCLK